MNAKIRSRLADTLDAARLIAEWVPQHSLETITNDRLIESAYLLQFERIGDTLRIVRDYDPEFDSHIPKLHLWIGLRHRLIHDYREIDLELLWTTAVVDIPLLIQELTSILDT